MNEVLKKQIDTLIGQIQTPYSPIDSEQPMNFHEQRAYLQTVHTIRYMAREYLMGLIAVGLDLGGMTEKEMFEVTARANADTALVNPAPKV